MEEPRMPGSWVRLAGAAAVMATTALVVAEGQRPAAGSQRPASPTAAVAIENFSFGPPTLTVAVGTIVTWTNRDGIPHMVVSGTFKSKVLDTTEKFSHTFAEAGTFPYAC